MNYLNPTWLLSRLLEKLGIDTYLARVEFAAHIFAGCSFALAGVLWGYWIPAAWVLFTMIDELLFDGWKGADTLTDFASKLAGPVAYLVWRLM